MNQELDEALNKGMATEERLAHLDAALRDCIQQISVLQEERELQEELKEANARLVRSLLCKQESVEELERDKLHLGAELDSLMARVDSLEKENAFLKCECCALERELVIHLDSAKKIVTLEDESYVKALVAKEANENSSRKISILVDRLCDVEEENQVLREIITARENELCSSKLKCAQVAYRLAVVEAELKDATEADKSKNSLMNHFMKDSDNQLESMSKQIVPVSLARTRERSMGEHGSWPWNVLDMILDEHQVSKRSFDDLLEEIKVSLAPQSCSEISGLITMGPDQAKSESNLNRSICRMIELLEEMSPSSLVGNCSDTNLDYSVHVFRWRNSELIRILRKFVLSCSLVLSGTHGLEEFAMQLTAVLEWAVGNCITLQDASHVRDRIRKHFRLDRSRSESELEVNSGDCENVVSKMIKIQCDVKEENARLTHKLRSLESANEELETRLRLAMEDNELLMSQLEESKQSIGRLQEELEDQIENQKLINEELHTQLTVAKVKQNETMQKLSCLEVELEDKNQCCEELEATCLELQLQLEIISSRGSPKLEEDGVEKNALTGWEMIVDCTELTNNTFTGNEKSKEHYSLRDRMLADDDDTKTKEIVCLGDVGKEKQPMKHQPDMGAAGAVLAVVPGKKPGRGGFGFVKKLFLRKRKCSSKNASTLLQRNASAMMR